MVLIHATVGSQQSDMAPNVSGGPLQLGILGIITQKNALPPPNTHTQPVHLQVTQLKVCVGTILNLHTLSRALSGEVQQKNTNNDTVLINLPSCIMQIYSTCILNGTATAYTHAGILIYVLMGRRCKYGEFLSKRISL